MNFLKRAMTSGLRQWGKTAILLMLIMLLGTVISSAVSMSRVINNTDANLRRRMRPIVSIGTDWEAWDAYCNDSADLDDCWQQIPPITVDHVRAIGCTR